MRLAALILVVISMVLLALAAYLGSDAWKLALYADLVSWSLTIIVLACALIEVFAEPSAAWVRALLALGAGGFSFVVSFSARPGTVGEFPFAPAYLVKSAVDIGALGAAAGAVIMGVAAVRLDKRSANFVAGAGMLLALGALRGWLQHRT